MTTKPNDVADDLERRLEQVEAFPDYGSYYELCADAIAALRAKPADKGREVVAWRYVERGQTGETFSNQPPDRVINVERFEVTPLYAHPPERQDDAVRKDAERYRYLRVHACGPMEGWSTHSSPESLDEVVDAALASQSPSTDREDKT